MRLRWTQVREGMSIRYWTPRTSRCSTGGHSTHHRASLSDLGAPWCRHTGVYLLNNASARVNGIWMLSVSHRVAWRQPRMLWDALMGREWLRHHHC